VEEVALLFLQPFGHIAISRSPIVDIVRFITASSNGKREKLQHRIVREKKTLQLPIMLYLI